MRSSFAAALALAAASVLAPGVLGGGAGAAWASEKLVCEIGPAKRRFGGTLWLVFACNDNKSLAFRPEQNNPNNTAVFLLRWTGTQYELEGSHGDKPEIAQKAYDEVADLTERQITDLISAAKAEN